MKLFVSVHDDEALRCDDFDGTLVYVRRVAFIYYSTLFIFMIAHYFFHLPPLPPFTTWRIICKSSVLWKHKNEMKAHRYSQRLIALGAVDRIGAAHGDEDASATRGPSAGHGRPRTQGESFAHLRPVDEHERGRCQVNVVCSHYAGGSRSLLRFLYSRNSNRNLHFIRTFEGIPRVCGKLCRRLTILRFHVRYDVVVTLLVVRIKSVNVNVNE